MEKVKGKGMGMEKEISSYYSLLFLLLLSPLLSFCRLI